MPVVEDNRESKLIVIEGYAPSKQQNARIHAISYKNSSFVDILGLGFRVWGPGFLVAIVSEKIYVQRLQAIRIRSKGQGCRPS